MTRSSTPHGSEHGHSGGMHCIPTKYLHGKSGLSRVEIALLAYVLDHPPERQGGRREIADDCGCVPNSIPRAAKALRELGLIESFTPGGGQTIYLVGRNLCDTARNMEDAPRISEVTTQDVVPSEPKQTTTDGVATSVLRLASDTKRAVTSPPTPPLVIRTQKEDTELNPETPKLEGDRGLGKEGFAHDGEAEPEPKRIRKRKPLPEFTASDKTLPRELTEEMKAIAGERKMINGTRDQEFRDWRRWHIEHQTVMKSANLSWLTWAKNWAKQNPPSRAGVPAGYIITGHKPDGTPVYSRDHSLDRYS